MFSKDIRQLFWGVPMFLSTVSQCFNTSIKDNLNEKFLLLVVLLIVPTLVFAAETAVWVEATGEAVGSDLDPPKEVMEQARNDAKRKAIEGAVGTFIRSHTLVTNGQLAEDLVFARVRGRIKMVKSISEKRDRRDPNHFLVRLRALVQPVYPQEGEGISITLSLSKTTLKEGEDVKIYYQTNADSYVYIFSIAADNSVTRLFPNSRDQDNFVRAHCGQVFPPDNYPIKLKAMSLPGLKQQPVVEKVKIIATRQREVVLQGFQEGLFQVYDAHSTGLVGDLARKLNRLDPADWGEALEVYSIEK
jgi:hypothetical protein